MNQPATDTTEQTIFIENLPFDPDGGIHRALFETASRIRRETVVFGFGIGSSVHAFIRVSFFVLRYYANCSDYISLNQ